MSNPMIGKVVNSGSQHDKRRLFGNVLVPLPEFTLQGVTSGRVMFPIHTESGLESHVYQEGQGGEMFPLLSS